MTIGAKSICVSATLHVAAIAAALAFSAHAKDDASEPAPVMIVSDPLLASLAPPDADPNKAAGLEGEEKGLADGSPDGGIAEQNRELEKMNEALKNLPEPDPEPDPELEPEVPAPAEPAPTPVPKKDAPAKKPEPAKKTEPTKKTSTEKPKKISFNDWKKNQKQSQKNSGGEKSSGKKRGNASVSKIDVSKIGVGGNGANSGGKKFGVSGGTGGNGGDGGRAVASAQLAYAAEVSAALEKNLDAVLLQSPLTLGATVSVSVRLGIGADGSVRLLEIVGNSDPQVRDRISRAVARIGKFRTPPEKKSFEMRVPEVVLRPR